MTALVREIAEQAIKLSRSITKRRVWPNSCQGSFG